VAADITPDQLLQWVDTYERAWRSPDTSLLGDLFATDATYLMSPYEQPVVGLAAIQALWEREREGPDEVFTMTREVVAVSGDTGVARVEVRYGGSREQEYRDLWVVTFDADRRVKRFEEWAFWPGHPYTAARSAPVVTTSEAVPATPYAEFVRTNWLSGGVYRLAAGAQDGQSPHQEDEVYVVTGGRASLVVDGEEHQMEQGSVAFVPARAEHRFVDIAEDLEVVVVFAPPESD
jgi:mannose-6-phosphate isomerase-like protein (cupin superfamily)